MIVLDTSALVRFFTNDIPAKASEVKSIIEHKEVLIPSVVLPELEYVLTSKTYNANRAKILKVYEYLITKKNIKTSKEISLAVKLYKTSKLDIADCIIVATSQNNDLMTFDKKMSEVKKLL